MRRDEHESCSNRKGEGYHLWKEAVSFRTSCHGTNGAYISAVYHKELWFQQDGATCHTARATIDLLKDTLGDRLISRFGPVNWPPRSCDLTPLDYFLWGYVKSLVYADELQTLVHLEDNIRSVIADIRPQTLEKVIKNWTSRLDYIRASRGSPMPEIIFKIPEAQKSNAYSTKILKRDDYPPIAGRRAVLLARWITRSVPLEIVGSSGQEKVLTRRKPGLERPGRPRGDRIMRQALVGPTVTRSTIRADVGVAIVPLTIFQTPCRSKS
ncbi:putative DD41D transposase [Trichonephila clavipes]|nr:putative DD41D transposase [Trichonephila clavipes]